MELDGRVYVAARTRSTGTAPSVAETGVIVFLTIGVTGLGGAVIAGRFADSLGRTTITSAAMLLSAGCCLLSPIVFGASAPLLVALLVLWGATVIADSAQFSAAVTELAERRYAGSVLALQLALGFSLTIISIRLVPIIADHAGWRFALVALALGPLVGTLGMLRLRILPAARRLANGRR